MTKYKKIFLIAIGLFFIPAISFGATISSDAGVIVNDTTDGIIGWTNPQNAQVQDGQYATAISNNQATYYLKATNFYLPVPTNATITDINVSIYGRSLWQSGQWRNVKIVKNNTIQSFTQATGQTFYDFLYEHNYNGLWNDTWTPADINTNNFGFVINFNAPNGNTQFWIDRLSITITYTTPPPPPPPPPPTPPVLSFTIPTSATADLSNTTTGILGGLWTLILIFIGAPLAFYLISKLFKIMPKDKKEKTDTDPLLDERKKYTKKELDDWSKKHGI